MKDGKEGKEEARLGKGGKEMVGERGEEKRWRRLEAYNLTHQLTHTVRITQSLLGHLPFS